jgi:hypothetical protein
MESLCLLNKVKMKKNIYNNEITENPKKIFWINNFEKCKSPKVLGKITIEEFLHKIKHGDENLLNIKNACIFDI